MSTTSLPRSEAEAATIRKPLPEDLFVHHDTNAEMRWESVRSDEALTPQDRLFVRNHTETPVIDADAWSLRIHGSGLLAPEAKTAAPRGEYFDPRERRSYVACDFERSQHLAPTGEESCVFPRGVGFRFVCRLGG